jgi:hypothetical protein
MTSIDREWLRMVKDGKKLVDELPAMIEGVDQINDRLILKRQFAASSERFKEAIGSGCNPVFSYGELAGLFCLIEDLPSKHEAAQ